MCQVIVIDDDKQVRESLKRLISEEGFSVKDAANGKIGLEIIKKENPCLVITDIIMPVGDGLEVITEISSKYPGINIIAISGGSKRLDDDELLDLATKIGADYTFRKPLNAKHIKTIINQIVK